MLLAMIILPLPPFILDILFTFNIALSMMVLLIALQTTKPLDFLSFPNVLLVTTILRLSLNVASTRLVLTQGHTGSGAAGKVIESFGHFLIGGNYAVGIVVFIILTIINFVVVTKGAGRIAEVGARFALDAMPGKQMSIEAELNAGHITQEQAKSKRTEITQEADFYGAMDGASKYVRGDAVAGVLVIIVNILGGFVVGVVQHDLGFSAAIKNYTLLAIGDGLVAQIPAIIVSVAAGVVVSRVSNDQDIGSQLITQLFSNFRTLFVTSAIIGVMGLIPGMPHLAFILFAFVFACLGQMVKKREDQKKLVAKSLQSSALNLDEMEVGWGDLKVIEPLSLEIGVRLVPLVAPSGEQRLIKRIRALRKAFAENIGFIAPTVQVSDNHEIDKNAYIIKIKGVVVAKGTAYPDRLFALNSGSIDYVLAGEQAIDPAFGLPAVWIDASQKEEAMNAGFTIVDTSTVIATHLSHLMNEHSHEFLGRSEINELLELAFNKTPRMKDDFIPKTISVFNFQRVLQNLLSEGLPIRDLQTIIDTLCEYGLQTQSPDELTEKVRLRMARSILYQLAPDETELNVIMIEDSLERLLLSSIQSTQGAAFEPGLAESLLHMADQTSKKQLLQGITPILVVPAILRLSLARFFKKRVPNLYVLSHEEILEAKKIKVNEIIGHSPQMLNV
jgi:flagellar biosynthesis protein FlhA